MCVHQHEVALIIATLATPSVVEVHVVCTPRTMQLPVAVHAPFPIRMIRVACKVIVHTHAAAGVPVEVVPQAAVALAEVRDARILHLLPRVCFSSSVLCL